MLTGWAAEQDAVGSRRDQVVQAAIDAVDRGPRHAGQPVNLALAQARIDRGPDDPVAAAATASCSAAQPASICLAFRTVSSLER